MTTAGVHSRGGQESCDEFQNIGIALCGVVESRGIDQNDPPPVEGEHVRECDLSRTRLQVLSDDQMRITRFIDKLETIG